MQLKAKVLPYVLQGIIELDEMYVSYAHKGRQLEGVKSKHRGTPARKAGLSKEQYCIVSGIDRKDTAFNCCVNTGKPSMEAINEACLSRIEEQSEILIDGLESYNEVIEKTKSSSKKLVGHKNYDKVHHLNTVNSLHNKIRNQYRRYRGVSSKYLNRYGALFTLQWVYRDMDKQELLLFIMKRLRKHFDYFYIRNIRNTSISGLSQQISS